IGFDRVLGYVDEPFDVLLARPQDVRIASRLTSVDLERRRHEVADVQLVDVRNPGEHALGGIPEAVNIPVGQLPERLDELDPQRPTVVYCAGGYRSSVAASLLCSRGFADVSDVVGGYQAWTQTSAP